MKQIALYDSWSEHAELNELEDSYQVIWYDKIHGVEPFEKLYTSLRAAVTRYNEFMNTNFERLNPDGTRMY